MRLGRENEFSKHLEAVFETATTSSHQDHYPERLGSAFFVNTPWLLHGFFTAASAFLDPVPWRLAPREPTNMSDSGAMVGLWLLQRSGKCQLFKLRSQFGEVTLAKFNFVSEDAWRRIGLRICFMASSKRPLELPSNCAEGHIATQTSCYTTQ